jgi:hypothetical protein
MTLRELTEAIDRRTPLTLTDIDGQVYENVLPVGLRRHSDEGPKVWVVWYGTAADGWNYEWFYVELDR